MYVRLASALLVFAAACGGGQQKPPPAPPSNQVVAEPAPAPPAPPPPAATHADGRPASVSNDMVALAEDLVVAMEAMGAELTAAGVDCAKGATALRTGTQNMKPIMERAKAFEKEMEAPEAEAWFKEHYMQRIMTAMGGMMQLAQSCASDKDFSAAAQEMGTALDN